LRELENFAARFKWVWCETERGFLGFLERERGKFEWGRRRKKKKLAF